MGAKTIKPGEAAEPIPSDLNIPDNYVQHTLRTVEPLPPITLSNVFQELNRLTASLLILSPLIGLYGAYKTPLCWQTGVWAVMYYFITGLGMSFS